MLNVFRRHVTHLAVWRGVFIWFVTRGSAGRRADFLPPLRAAVGTVS
jgi:hypothetical protein